MAKHITVRAAQPNTRDQEIEPVYLTITECFPYSLSEDEINKTREGFKEDAERLFIALRSLPGGTFDQLLILMLQKAASSFIVPHNFHDEKEVPSMLALLEKALPMIQCEASNREATLDYSLYSVELRNLANEIKTEIDKAYGREAPEPELCPHGFGFVEYCPDCKGAKGKEAQHG